MENLLQNDTTQVSLSQEQYAQLLTDKRLSFEERQELLKFSVIISAIDGKAFNKERKYDESLEWGVEGNERDVVTVIADIGKLGNYAQKTGVRFTVFPRKLKQMGVKNIDDFTNLLINVVKDVTVKSEWVGKPYKDFYKDELGIILKSAEGVKATSKVLAEHVGNVYAKEFTVMPINLMRKMNALASGN